MCTPAARTSPARHIFFSIFLVHPQHPYGKLERFFLLLCTVLFGFGLSALIVVALLYAENAALGLSGNSTDPVYADAYARYEEFKDSGNRWTVLLCSTVLVQALYDNFAKVLFICSCSQAMCLKNKPKCQACLERFARYATYFCLLIAIGVAASAAWTAYLPFKDRTAINWADVLQTWGITRAIGWLGIATLVVVVKFVIKRKMDCRAYYRRSPSSWGEPSKESWMTGGEPNTPWPRLEDLGNLPPSETSLCSNVGRPKGEAQQSTATLRRGHPWSTITVRGSAKILPTSTTVAAADSCASAEPT
jgi:hypothetical protein